MEAFTLLSSADSADRTKCFLIAMRKKKIQWTHDIRLFREIISARSLWSRKKKSIVINVAPVEAFPFAAVLVTQ